MGLGLRQEGAGRSKVGVIGLRGPLGALLLPQLILSFIQIRAFNSVQAPGWLPIALYQRTLAAGAAGPLEEGSIFRQDDEQRSQGGVGGRAGAQGHGGAVGVRGWRGRCRGAGGCAPIEPTALPQGPPLPGPGDASLMAPCSCLLLILA